MANFRNITTFDFEDVRLLPKKSIVKSRSTIDTTVIFGEKTFEIPVIPANMSTIMDSNLAEYLAKNGYFYVMHRFDIDPFVFTKNMHDRNLFSSISLGIKETDFNTVDKFSKLPRNEQPEYITIDVAHGHSQEVINIVNHISEKLRHTFIIAGNVATPEAARELEHAGANAIKVGVGPGLSCITSPNTGFGTRNWQLSAVNEISKAVNEALVIADGGIRNYGDIAKAIAFGADMVMIGGMFAGHDENPGEIIIDENGNKVKVFFGSASEHQKGKKEYVEGKKMLLPYKGPISETLKTIKQNLQSAISYAGGDKLEDLFNSDYLLLNKN